MRQTGQKPREAMENEGYAKALIYVGGLAYMRPIGPTALAMPSMTYDGVSVHVDRKNSCSGTVNVCVCPCASAGSTDLNTLGGDASHLGLFVRFRRSATSNRQPITLVLHTTCFLWLLCFPS